MLRVLSTMLIINNQGTPTASALSNVKRKMVPGKADMVLRELPYKMFGCLKGKRKLWAQ